MNYVMYAQVVVLTYQPPDTDSYTYKIPKILQEEIKVGQLVEVPFGKRTPQGVIIGITSSHPKQREGSRDSSFSNQNDSKIIIKRISEIVFPAPFLLPYQIKLLQWMSFYYISPMVNCLEAMLPELPSKSSIVNSSSAQKIAPINDERSTINQSLILTPTLNQIPETLAKFPHAKNHIIYHNELKLSQKFSAWFKILSGNADYIFGSRSAIFAPCPNLKEIIIFDEHDTTYKDERSPYFDTLTIAQKISALTGADINIFDSSPKITTYFNFRAHLKSVSQTTPKHYLSGDKGNIKVKIVSMQNERLSGNFSPISYPLQNLLVRNHKLNKNSLLFLNKKKESGSLYCKNCKFNDYFEKQPQMCPKCKSQDLYFNVLNVNSLAAEVKRFTHNSPIDIATATIFYAPSFKKYDLVSYIQPDPLLSRADFSAAETLYTQISLLKKTLKKNGTLVIQTYNPNNANLKAIASNNYPSYFEDQLRERRLLSYPPFALFVKLSIKGRSLGKTEDLTHQIFSEIQSRLQTTDYRLQTSLLGPFKPVFFSKQPTFNIIIKYKLKSYSLLERENAINNLAPVLKEVSKKAQIIVEPISIN